MRRCPRCSAPLVEADRYHDRIAGVWYRCWVCPAWPDHPAVREPADGPETPL